MPLGSVSKVGNVPVPTERSRLDMPDPLDREHMPAGTQLYPMSTDPTERSTGHVPTGICPLGTFALSVHGCPSGVGSGPIA